MGYTHPAFGVVANVYGGEFRYTQRGPPLTAARGFAPQAQRAAGGNAPTRATSWPCAAKSTGL